MSGLRTSAAVQSWGDAGGAELLRERPKVQRCRKCETSPALHPRARPGLPRVSSPAPASEGRRPHPSRRRELGGRSPGKPLRPGHTEGSGRHKDPRPLIKAPEPEFPSLQHSGHFTRSGRAPGPAWRPRPPPALSLGTLAALPRFPAAPAPRPRPRQPRACLVSAPPRFLYSYTFCPAKLGKVQLKKPPPKNNVSATSSCTSGSKVLMHPLLRLQPRAHGLKPRGANVSSQDVWCLGPGKLRARVPSVGLTH